MKPRWTKWLKVALPGAILAGFSAGCFGGDPTYFFSTAITDAVIYSLITTVVNALLTGATTTAAILLG